MFRIHTYDCKERNDAEAIAMDKDYWALHFPASGARACVQGVPLVLLSRNRGSSPSQDNSDLAYKCIRRHTPQAIVICQCAKAQMTVRVFSERHGMNSRCVVSTIGRTQIRADFVLIARTHTHENALGRVNMGERLRGWQVEQDI